MFLQKLKRGLLLCRLPFCRTRPCKSHGQTFRCLAQISTSCSAIKICAHSLHSHEPAVDLGSRSRECFMEHAAEVAGHNSRQGWQVRTCLGRLRLFTSSRCCCGSAVSFCPFCGVLALLATTGDGGSSLFLPVVVVYLL